MNKINTKITLSFFVILFITFIFLACNSKKEVQNHKTTVMRRNINQEIIFSAKISPFAISNVFPTVKGTIESIAKFPGSRLTKGDAVIVIKDNSNMRHNILAKESGILLAINYSIGDFIGVPSNQFLPLFTTGQDGKKVINAEVDEMDAKKIIAGDTLLVFNNESFSIIGKIDFVNLLASNNDGSPRFKVSGHLSDSTNLILQFGNSVPVKVVKMIAQNILTIEREYLIKKADKVYLKILNTNKIEEKEVVIGVENENYTEIKSGVTEGEIVVL